MPHDTHSAPEPVAHPGTTRFVLVMHGQSEADIDNRIAGLRTCGGLTAVGQDQGRAVAVALAQRRDLRSVSKIYSTPVARVLDTAQYIGAALGVAVDPQLPSPRYGAAEGRTWQSLHASSVPPLAFTPDVALAEGADSWIEWVDRVGAAVTTLADIHRGAAVVAVVHRGWILAMDQWVRKVAPSLRFAVADTAPTALTVWDLRAADNAAGLMRWVLVRHNDTDHLSTARQMTDHEL